MRDDDGVAALQARAARWAARASARDAEVQSPTDAVAAQAPAAASPSDWTVDDLDRLPDDGLRYELVDGVLLVSAAPLVRHQLALAGLLLRLGNAAPPHFVSCRPRWTSPSAARACLSPTSTLHVDQLTGRKVSGVPLLAVEVLSASTRATRHDAQAPRPRAGRVPSYWLVDPEAASLTGLELVEGSYREVAVAQGDVPLTVQRPFSVTPRPCCHRVPTLGSIEG